MITCAPPSTPLSLYPPPYSPLQRCFLPPPLPPSIPIYLTSPPPPPNRALSTFSLPHSTSLHLPPCRSYPPLPKSSPSFLPPLAPCASHFKRTFSASVSNFLHAKFVREANNSGYRCAFIALYCIACSQPAFPNVTERVYILPWLEMKSKTGAGKGLVPSIHARTENTSLEWADNYLYPAAKVKMIPDSLFVIKTSSARSTR